MAITGIESVTYGVEDLDAGVRFFTDWGLRRRRSGTGAVFETADGSRVVLRRHDDPALPPAIEPGPTLREVVWGVSSARAVKALADGLARDRDVTMGRDGIARCLDDMGLGVGFVRTRRNTAKASAPEANSPGRTRRLDRPAAFYDRARPHHIGHVVFFVADVAAVERFYTRRLGFRVSDRYPGRGVFLRCRPRAGHHTLFALERPDRAPGLNHVAFTVRDVHEVFAGGLYFAERGWDTELGPGRHPISSAYFWYFRNPCGGAAEYYADEDQLTEKWRPRRFEPSTANFAEWALPDGLRRPKGPPRSDRKDV